MMRLGCDRRGQEPRGERERSGEVEGQCCLEALRRLPTLGEPSTADIVDEHVNPADTTADLVSEAPVFTNGERVSDDEIDGVVTGLTSELETARRPRASSRPVMRICMPARASAAAVWKPIPAVAPTNAVARRVESIGDAMAWGVIPSPQRAPTRESRFEGSVNATHSIQMKAGKRASGRKKARRCAGDQRQRR